MTAMLNNRDRVALKVSTIDPAKESLATQPSRI